MALTQLFHLLNPPINDMPATVTPTFSFSIWGDEPRQDSPHWNPESDPKQVSGRYLAERLRPKPKPRRSWREHPKFKKPDEGSPYNRRIVPPSGNPVGGNSAPKQTPPTATIETQPAFDFDPYGWAIVFWVTGLVVWYRHPQFFIHWCVFAAAVFLFAPPKPLIHIALLIAVGWFLLQKYWLP